MIRAEATVLDIGSNLVSDAGTTLVAGNNVSIEAAIER